MKKNIYLDFGGEFSLNERLTKIKARGFDGIFIFYDEFRKLEPIVKAAKMHALDVETMHLPFKGCNRIWSDDETGEEYKNLLIDGVRLASKLAIPTVIMHLVGGLNRPRPNEIGAKRIAEIIKVCEEHKISLALENVRETLHNDYIFSKIKSPYLKMCFDFGHVNCFTQNTYEFDFETYCEYLICCHIHDNDGTFDHHHLPFTGNVDYKYIVEKLKAIGFNGPLTSEARNDDYGYPEEDFIDKVFMALTKIESYFGDENE